MGYITVRAAQDYRGVDSVGPRTEARVRSYRRTLQYVVVRGCARNYRRQTDGQASFISLRLSSESIAELQCRYSFHGIELSCLVLCLLLFTTLNTRRLLHLIVGYRKELHGTHRPALKHRGTAQRSAPHPSYSFASCSFST